jgi:hypothetical protein
MTSGLRLGQSAIVRYRRAAAKNRARGVIAWPGRQGCGYRTRKPTHHVCTRAPGASSFRAGSATPVVGFAGLATTGSHRLIAEGWRDEPQAW